MQTVLVSHLQFSVKCHADAQERAVTSQAKPRRIVVDTPQPFLQPCSLEKGPPLPFIQYHLGVSTTDPEADFAECWQTLMSFVDVFGADMRSQADHLRQAEPSHVRVS